MKAIYKFHLDYGRAGRLDGVFVANKEDIEQRLGKEIYFGECLGKHSEVISVLRLEDHYFRKFIMVTDDPLSVALFERHNLDTGINPLDYPYRKVGTEDWIEV